MPSAQLNHVIRHLRQAARQQEVAASTDGQLLDRFLARREEAAFAALVRRHGPMVFGVCRRVLHHTHDAEDAFQATFLVLVRKAASIKPRDLVGSWLYGVAYRTALKARTANAVRRAKERQVREMPRDNTQDFWRDLEPLLDQELHRLPEKYRVPVVLCDLEGKSREAAAKHIGCPEGTLSSRLARGRSMLAKRLARHGLALSGGAVAALLAQNAATAGVPSSLALSTVQAAALFAAGKTAAGVVSAKAAALTQGVLKAMLMTKLKIATAVLFAVGVVGMGSGALMHQVQAAKTTGDTTVADLKEDADKRAQKDFDTAEFFLKTGHPDTAYFYFALVCKRYPGTPFAEKATERMNETLAKAEDKNDDAKADPVKEELKMLEGTWKYVSAEMRGQAKPEDEIKGLTVVIKGDSVVVENDGKSIGGKGKITIDPTKKPKTMDLVITGNNPDEPEAKQTYLSIYELDGDTLRICLGIERPEEFKMTAETGNTEFTVLKRAKRAPKDGEGD
ncbi:MAG TPA: sigma-70 family RNA polymerase sigma factor, partial [Gemmataceae bacterium]